MEQIGELIIHYNDDEYQHHIPVSVDLDRMEAEFFDDGNGEYWAPEEPFGSNWEESSWEEIEVDGEVYPAFRDGDTDGLSYADDNYGQGQYIVIITPAF